MSDLHVHIRPMMNDDRGMVFSLAEDVLRPLAECTGHPELFHDEEFLALLQRGEVFVAEAPGEPREIAGYVVVEADAPALAVRCVCVGPAFEGQHVGHRLLDWAEGLAYNRGLDRLEATVAQADEPSQHLYREHDFVPAPAPDRPELIVMRKRLR
jgi:ribosomal protein S18 acetylase RimI-like enzyme